MVNIQVNINKLNSNNCGNWAADIKYILLDKNDWEIVIGKEKSPEKTDTTAVKDFQARSRTALSLIYLNIESEFCRIIKNIDNLHIAWNKIKLHFKSDNRARHMQLFSELITCKIKPDEPVDMFAACIQRIAEQLQAMKEQVKKNILVFSVAEMTS